MHDIVEMSEELTVEMKGLTDDVSLHEQYVIPYLECN